jgi:hypothetical protein
LPIEVIATPLYVAAVVEPLVSVLKNPTAIPTYRTWFAPAPTVCNQVEVLPAEMAACPVDDGPIASRATVMGYVLGLIAVVYEPMAMVRMSPLEVVRDVAS